MKEKLNTYVHWPRNRLNYKKVLFKKRSYAKGITQFIEKSHGIYFCSPRYHLYIFLYVAFAYFR